jgi:hypothetical protein
MGLHKNIGINKFPKQGDQLGKRTKVCFNYDSSKQLEGTIVRDDREEPLTTLIQLDDGRVLNATECQYTFPK